MIDERYLLHRLRSTSLAGVVGAILIGGWFFYQFLTRQVLRWDLFVILAVMAVIKVSAVTYYRMTD